MPKYLEPPFGVIVETWGTSTDTSSSGMKHYYDTKLFGGDVGHAGLGLRLPLDQISLVKKYCGKGREHRTPIPCEIKTDATTGKQYIEVRFSWWEAGLSSSLAEDRGAERTKHDVTKHSDQKDLEEIYVEGELGDKKIKLAPVGVVEGIDDTELTEYLQLYVEQEKLRLDIKALDFLINKYHPNGLDTSKTVKASKASKSHIKNLLGSDLPKEFLVKSKFTREDCNEINRVANEKLRILIEKQKNISKLIGLRTQELSVKDADIHELEQKIAYFESIIAQSSAKTYVSSVLGGYTKNAALKEKQHLEEKKKLFLAVKQKLANEKERHLLLGVREDASVHLPIGEDGMDVEAMLKEMREIADNERFDLKFMNCSAVSLRILSAGAPRNLKDVANLRAWGFFANPQKVFNTSEYFRKAFNGELSVHDKITTGDLLGIDRLVGFVIRGYVKAMQKDEAEHAKQNISADDSHKKITLNKIGAVLIGLFIAPIVAILYILKHLLRPSLFIKDCASLLNWVFENNSVLFKLIFTAALVPAIIMHLIPAMLEQTIYGIFSLFYAIITGISNIFKTKVSIEAKNLDKLETDSICAEICQPNDDYQSLLTTEDLAVDDSEQEEPSAADIHHMDISAVPVVAPSYERLTAVVFEQYQKDERFSQANVERVATFVAEDALEAINGRVDSPAAEMSQDHITRAIGWMYAQMQDEASSDEAVGEPQKVVIPEAHKEPNLFMRACGLVCF